MSLAPHQIVKRPVISEKTNLLKEAANHFAFEVDRRANKIEIRRAVEALFNVHVVDISTSILHGKVKRVGRRTGRQSNWKKAIVKLKAGETIDFFAGV
jgi:large subunit ribosomal protein L23